LGNTEVYLKQLAFLQKCDEREASNKKTALWAGIGLTGLMGFLSYKQGQYQIDQCARLGFVCQGNQYGNISTGLTSGLSGGGGSLISYGLGGSGNAGRGSYGYPYMNNGLYGVTPGGYSSGSMGCGQTVNGSQLGYSPGVFSNGSNYFPGGAYMPGAGNWGVSPSNYMQGWPGAVPGMSGGGFNSGIYSQVGLMQQQAQDQLRAAAIGMYSVGYGLNAANQQYNYAASLMSQSLTGGNSYYSTMGLSPYMSGSFTGGYTQNACGSSRLGNSISICGSIPLGGSFSPTFTNSFNYGGSNTSGYFR
jgi:hypothetical protein